MIDSSQESTEIRRQPNLIAVFDLISKSQHCASALELNFLLVNLTKQLVDYDQAILYREGRGFQAISGLSELDVNSPMLIWLKSFVHQLRALKVSGQLDVAKLRPESTVAYKEWFSIGMAVFPFLEEDSKNYGFLLLTRSELFDIDEIRAVDFWLKSWLQSLMILELNAIKSGPGSGLFDYMIGLLTAIRERAPQKMHSFFLGVKSVFKFLFGGGCRQLLSPSTYMQALRSAKTKLSVDKKLRWKAYFLLVFVFPIRLTVISPGEIVASNPLVVRSSIEGVIEKFHVQPNAFVKKDQTLFSYDSAAIASKSEAARQSLYSAEAEYRQSLILSLSDTKQKSNLAIFQSKVEEKKAEYQYLAQQLNRSTMTAPIDGYAIFDDPAELVGKPIMVGERIMLLADPKEVEVQAWISLSDMIEISNGAAVTLYPNPNPFGAIDGNVRYVTYEPVQLPEGHYAYRLRATIKSGQALPRLGIKGTVKVSGKKVPLIYWMLRKPISQIRQFIGL